MRKDRRVNVLGIGISVTNLASALSTIEAWIEWKESYYICVTGVHGVMECQKNERLRSIHNRSGLTVPDGMPMVWIGRWNGFREMGRVYGPDLMMEVCRASVAKGYTHFLYGGKPGIVEELRSNLEERYPGIRIQGTYSPPFRPLNRGEEAELTAMIERTKPDLFWIGLSTPKQEYFMADHVGKLAAKIMIGVGAAFDIHAGNVKDAPQWIKRSGMQWCHRLMQEPRRLWKRYLLNNPRFVCLILRQLLWERMSLHSPN
jgi:N-acetylglucosaminyldiphosphoundecaprenol N-acetyl-beta-D-mannosaminyltransferase